ncbi:MAG: hypothetical protein WD359_10690 [Dehalococcoidia bacterium]
MKRSPLILLVLSSVLIAACGVRFADATPGTEFFTEIEISGEMRAGAPLTVLVQYEQFYPVDVTFHCELRRKKEIIKRLGEHAVIPLENGAPDKTPFPGAIAFDFSVDAPGEYIVECLTEKDEDNFIGDEITIAPAEGGTPVP